MAHAKFFMRFYNKEKEQVEKFVADFREKNPAVVKHTIERLTRSVNWHLDTSVPAFEVFFYFKTKGARDTAYADPETRRAYVAFNDSTMENFCERQPGMPVHAVGGTRLAEKLVGDLMKRKLLLPAATDELSPVEKETEEMLSQEREQCRQLIDRLMLKRTPK